MGSLWDPVSTKGFQALQACWSWGWFVLPIAILSSLILGDFEGNTKGVKAPIVGRWPLEPYFLTGLRFKRWSMAHLAEGYSKVSFRSKEERGRLALRKRNNSSKTKCLK